MTDKKEKLRKVAFWVLLIAIIFIGSNMIVSVIADMSAYADAVAVSDDEWSKVRGKLAAKDKLTSDDYDLIFSQTGLGKPAVDKLVAQNDVDGLEFYKDYYLRDKDAKCVREGILAYHEYITDDKGEQIRNPMFADLQNGDIIITLSIHSYGWRHGHAAIVVDAQQGIFLEAVMIGEKTAYGSSSQWTQYPCVAVLRAKDLDAETRNEVAQNAVDKFLNTNYALTAGIFGNKENPKATNCSHLVWYAFNEFGVNIDSDGGMIVTPKDILYSSKLEVVQVYGSIYDM